MAGSSFGTLFRVTTFGESHGPAVGCIVDGCPAGIPFDLALVQHDLDRRRPGQSKLTTQRKEGDERGSWDTVGTYSDSWGRVGQTAIGAMCLEVYYRYGLLNPQK